MGYNAGEAAGLLAGAQTISAVIGVADDTINGLNISTEQKNNMINIIPVAYAVTYIYGTAGSAWVLSSLGPKMLGGLEKVKAACKELEAKWERVRLMNPASNMLADRSYSVLIP